LPLVAVLFAASLCVSCAVVKPYERECLADPIMGLDGEGLVALYEQKLLETREAGLPVAGSASAGCGCK
jgi:ABC-type enterobactin transport system permease subunit